MGEDAGGKLIRRAAALLIVGWVLTGYTIHDGTMMLREYRTQAQCNQVAYEYNVEHVWNGPQGVLPLLEGELFCSGDETEGTFPIGTWHTEEWLPRPGE